MVRHFWNVVRAFGALTSIMTFFLLFGMVVVVLQALRDQSAELFPPPLQYLDASVSGMGELYYRPQNGSYCLGDTALWLTNAYSQRSVSANVTYFLQTTHPYQFVGRRAAEFRSRYPGANTEVVALYQSQGASFHTREGTFIGGQRSFRIPRYDELQGSPSLKPGDLMRLYVEIDAAFSQGSGYFVDWTYGADCEAF